ncbi:MAG: HAMP domain-containing histidine kinase [Colwelliaceae bacterium]|nr:HAMP domain-containing histidine kinase [Colwelliaceae bacterium]
MSLRNYLFILIGCLIALLTITQLIIVHWIENNLAKEVDFQARHYSDQIIELAVQKFDNNKNPAVILKHSINDEKVKVLDKDIQLIEIEEELLSSDVDKTLTDKIKQIDIAKSNADNSPPVARKMITREFKALVNTLHKEKAKVFKHQNTRAYVVNSPNTVSHTWISSSEVPSNSDALFKKIQITLIVVGILGLIFAYWLSAKFNKPLKSLIFGFNLLAKGNYQNKVREEGVKEIRDTISHFNKMVERLSHLSHAEKQHKEIAHLAELGEVSRGLAHALRNPIHTIGLSIEQLSDESIEQTQKEQLIQTIQRKIENIDKNIKALLTLTTTGVRRDEKIPLSAVIQDIILEYKSSATKKINFNIEIQDGLSLYGAESEIRSIFHTLINNACDASESDGTISISTKQTDHSLSIEIVDNGQGLNSHIEEKLFQPHVSTKPEGAGMGLYIANRLISLHYHGSLTLKNTLDNKQQINGCIAQAKFTIKNENSSNNGNGTHE